MRALWVALGFSVLVQVAGASPQPDADILVRAEAAKPFFLEDLRALVAIDSPTGDVAGIRRVIDLVSARLAALGAEVRELSGTGPNPPRHLVASLTGTGKKSFLLLAHMDTVFPLGTAAARPFRIEGTRAYGPGVLDDKSGIALALRVMKLVKEKSPASFARLTLFLDSDEETGSLTSRDLIVEEARRHDYVFCIEPGTLPDGMVVWRKGNGFMEVEVRGRMAHAGVEPEKGLNAAMELTHQVRQIAAAASRIPDVWINFTMLKAGDRVNVIPDRASATADLRYLDRRAVETLTRDAEALAAKVSIPGIAARAKITLKRPPLPPTTAGDALAARLQSIYAELGRTLSLGGSGGGTDANYAAAAGAVTLDGVGVVGGDEHSPDEWLDIPTIVPRVYLIARGILELGH